MFDRLVRMICDAILYVKKKQINSTSAYYSVEWTMHVIRNKQTNSIYHHVVSQILPL